jgi:hypothetical protein
MTEKEMFEVIKYFKSIYTAINNDDEIYITNNKIVYRANPFYILYGELQNDESNEFLKWIKDKSATIKISDLNELRVCLKKNVKNVVFDDKRFRVEYENKDSIPLEFLCSNEINKEYDLIVKKINDITKQYIKEYSIEDSLFNEELFIAYLDKDLNITLDRTENKVVEIPGKRILSLQKNSEKFLKISEKSEEGKRFVEISSKSDLLNLSQIFATI